MPTRHLFAFLGTLVLILTIGGLIMFREPIINFALRSTLEEQQSPSRISKAIPRDADNSSLITSSLDVSIGPKDARVTVVEFLDFQCPFCKAVHPTLKQLMQEYRGKSVRFVFRHFPIISVHPQALPASNASLCAHEQGQFLAYYDLLYTRQDEISPAGFVNFARDAGLKLQQFNTCLGERRYETQIKNDVRAGLELGIEGTPTWFVNNVRLVGALPYETFKAAIEKELQRASNF